MRYLITFAYDGSIYSGYQKQIGKNTIQNQIEQVLYKLNSNKVVSLHATGRTDAGVHALNQKAHFDIQKTFDLEKLKNSMNKMLPNDIYVKKVEIVSDSFHARFDVKSKEYIYKINIGEYNPLQTNYVLQYNNKLNIDKMKEALKYIEGTHNFKSFTKTTPEIIDYRRTILKTDVNLDANDNNIVIISIVGTGFMRYMVRNIVGFLIDVGSGKKEPESVIAILKLEDRCASSKTAPACGLYLKDIFY